MLSLYVLLIRIYIYKRQLDKKMFRQIEEKKKTKYKLQFEKIAEYEIQKETHSKIQTLLQQSFDAYPQRSYYKQVPNFRWLVWDGANLVGQMGVEHRIITLDGEPTRIFGVVDLCIHPNYRSAAIATHLIRKLEELGIKSEVDFIVLFADNHSLYIKNGFEHVTNLCKWMMINEHKTLGVARRRLNDCILVKPLGDKKWTTGEVDFLGIVF